MADDLEMQEPEVQETPTAEQVPQQALFEPRNIAEAIEMPDPEPQPEQAVQQEQDIPPVEPSWLNEPPPAPEAPQYPPEYPPYVQDYYGQPQYPQQPTAQPRTGGDAALNAFVEDPDGWWARKMEAERQAMVGPLQQQQQSIAFMMSTLIDNNVRQSAAQADASIRKAYDYLNKDPAFRSNKRMQDAIAGTFKGMKDSAIAQARQGNFGPLNALQNLADDDIAGTMGYLRGKYGSGSPGVGPLQIEGAAVESSRAPVAEQGVELSAEQEEIARRMGPGYRAKMVKAIKDQQKYNDLEWKE